MTERATTAENLVALVAEAWDFIAGEWGGTQAWDDPTSQVGAWRERATQAFRDHAADVPSGEPQP